MISTLKRVLIPIVFAFLAVFIQASILRVWIPQSFLPALAVIIVVYLGFHEVSLLGVWLAFLVGLIFDSSSGMTLGPWATACVALYGVLGAISRRVFLDSVISGMIISGVSALFSLSVYVLVVSQFHPALGFSLAAIAGGSIATAISAPFVLGLIVWSYRRFGPRG